MASERRLQHNQRRDREMRRRTGFRWWTRRHNEDVARRNRNHGGL